MRLSQDQKVPLEGALNNGERQRREATQSEVYREFNNLMQLIDRDVSHKTLSYFVVELELLDSSTE